MHRAVADDVLGPGCRAILWVQGCSHRCAGCIAPEGWDLDGGRLCSVDEVAGWVLSQSGIEGITISGGEPMLQAWALARVIRAVRLHADLGVVCYTGYVLPPRTPGAPGVVLRRTPARAELLSLLDMIVDGPYVEARHGDFLWRASANQRLILMTPRYRALLQARADTSAGIVCTIDAQGRPQVVGVPNRPGFREEFERHARARGVRLDASGRGPSLREARRTRTDSD
ncbi:MAG: radical SAM protein [Chthonomonadales bacterium]|nr:radical SAM protein [Chthonomonadales bacterium]